MSIEERLFRSRLLLDMGKDPDYARTLKLKDESYFIIKEGTDHDKYTDETGDK
ncbi:MAG: hypothetical protein IJ608_11950 [Lachnospiraceae bacterium]|nr:hypothetical protein [Lachnospiraceae bacterium]